VSSSVDQLREGVGAAEWQALEGGLSAEKLHELAQLWLNLADLPTVKAALVRAVIDAIPEWGDRALLRACSRVSWENNEAAIRVDGSAS
jgi:hypothetical protein